MKCIEDEIPFDLPNGWVWARLSSISEAISDGDHQPPPQSTSGIPFLVITNVSDGRLCFENTRFVPEKYYDSLSDTRKPQKGDILFTVTGSYGIPILIESNVEFCFQRHIAIIRPCLVSSEYTYVLLGSAHIKAICDNQATGVAQKTVSLTTLRDFLVPIAPYAEQLRIFARAQIALIRINDITSAKENLQDLINTAKSKILDLAIRGQLVPQNPDDEPASALLERIRAEKEELIKAGKIKRDKKESFIFKGEDNSYYLSVDGQVESIDEWNMDMIPDSWTLCCLGEVCDYGNCINVETTAINDTDWILDLEDIEKDSGRVLKKVMKKGRNANSTKHKFHRGQVLYSKLRPYLNKVVLADGDGYCTSEILPLEFDEIIVPAYARYFMMSPTFLAYADRCSYGVKMPRLGTPDGKKAVLAVPPVNEQKRIVNALNAAFEQLDKIVSTIE